jgi:hypothetical protein
MAQARKRLKGLPITAAAASHHWTEEEDELISDAREKGSTVAEIAEWMEVPTSSVKSRLATLDRRIAKHLKEIVKRQALGQALTIPQSQLFQLTTVVLKGRFAVVGMAACSFARAPDCKVYWLGPELATGVAVRDAAAAGDAHSSVPRQLGSPNTKKAYVVPAREVNGPSPVHYNKQNKHFIRDVMVSRGEVTWSKSGILRAQSIESLPVDIELLTKLFSTTSPATLQAQLDALPEPPNYA